MDPLLVLLLSMVVVIGGVLKLRLHPFLALLLGALIVAVLTSPERLFYEELKASAVVVQHVESEQQIRVRGVPEDSQPDTYVWLRPDAAGSVQALARVMGEPSSLPKPPPSAASLPAKGDGVGHDVHDPLWHVDVVSELSMATEDANVSWEVGDWLVTVEAFKRAENLVASSWADRISSGFGVTCGRIGILIAMAAIIGRCLLESNAAQRIVTAIQQVLADDRRTPIAFALSGFVIGVPVYFDTVFYLLLPLARTLARRTQRDYLLYVMAIIVGATMAHSLVPPTPGPLLVAAELNVPLGLMMLAGIVVGTVAMAGGYAYSVWANRRWPLPLRDIPGEAETPTRPESVQTSAALMPPLGWSVLPILLPVILLALGTLIRADWNKPDVLHRSHVVGKSLWIASDKHMALGIATAIAIVLAVKYGPSKSRGLPKAMQETLAGAGSIVLITSAGGAFGQVLRQSGIASAIESQFPTAQTGLSILVLAFIVTSVIRIAQGSATVAMITTVGVFGPLIAANPPAFHPVYLALAIGCGSKPIPWMNDSGFWVITRMSGMTESESLRTFSVVLTLMGIIGLLTTLAGAVWLPLV